MNNNTTMYHVTFRQNGRTREGLALTSVPYGEEMSKLEQQYTDAVMKQLRAYIDGSSCWNNELIIEVRKSDYKPSIGQKIGRLFR